MGALVWQNNDIWQGVSWSAIEYSGRWKVLNYGLASVFSPVVINAFWTPENETLTVLVTSDRWDIVNGTAQLTWFGWNGSALGSHTYDFMTPSLNNSVIFEATGLANILPEGAAPEDAFLRLNMTAIADNRTVTNEQFVRLVHVSTSYRSRSLQFTPTTLANALLVDPLIHVTASDNATFTLSARGGVAPWTWVDHPLGTVGYFVDNSTRLPSNGFYLIPGEDRTGIHALLTFAYLI